MDTSRKIKVAISGGGLAGAAIARALLPQSHLEVHIYESASEFSESGQGIILAVNAQNALRRFFPDVEGMFLRAESKPLNSTRIMMGAGPRAGDLVVDVAEESPNQIIARAAIVKELFGPVPRNQMHANKKLVLIEDQQRGLLLKFADGTEAQADALIGADGIFGFVRSHILGADHEATKPVPAGWAGTVNPVPFDEAEAKLGKQYFEQNRQYGWVGKNGIFIHDRIMGGKILQCIGTSANLTRGDERRIPLTRESLENAFSDWLDGPITKGMIDLLLYGREKDQDDPAAWAQYEHVNAPTYFKGRVCIAGDAAHAMTPWQASGAATALEDAVILGVLFEKIHSVDQLEQLFRTYDTVRRPRSQRIAESSRQTGRIMTGMDGNVGLDLIKMRDALKHRWDFIYGLDLEKHIEDALRIFNQG